MFTFLKLKLLYASFKKYLSFAKDRYTLAELFLSFGGAGFLKPASGTWGSLAALPFAGLLLFFFGPWALLIGAAFIYAVAVPVIFWFEKKGGEHDASFVVIDEVIGMFITLIPAVLSFWSFFIGFILFRALDALKPGPIGWVDQNMPGSHGVLLDDVLAGLTAAACLFILQLILI